MRSLLTLCVLTAASTLGAQSSFVLPTSAATSDAPGVFGIDGLGGNGRTQILIDASRLDPNILGRTITELAFRRDFGILRDFDTSTADVTVVVSELRRPAVQAAESFDANLAVQPGDRTVVWQGPITIPASSDPTARAADWADAQDVIVIPFATHLPYQGGGLCIDITGTPATGSQSVDWPLDGVRDGIAGSSSIVGSPCSRTSAGFLYLGARTADEDLVPGSSAEFWARGPSGVSTALVFGAPIPAVDLETFGLGAVGCTLYTDPAIALTTNYSVAELPATELSVATASALFRLKLPGHASASGLSLRAQFVNLSFPIETTNAVDFTTAVMPTSGFATVRGAAGDAAGRVSTVWRPVMRVTTTP